MQFLIDTHTFLWFVTDDSKLSKYALSKYALELIENETNEAILSVATLWEIAIKFSIGKLILNKPFQDFVDEQIQINEFQLLNVEFPHINIVSNLPLHHRDPFDRMLIAQSIAEGLPIISADTAFDAYGVTRLW
jgi:PIN domain nuclease of toxin-antitoxin system